MNSKTVYREIIRESTLTGLSSAGRAQLSAKRPTLEQEKELSDFE